MGTIVKPHTFADNENPLYTDVNSDFDTIYNEFNGGIDNDNLDPAAGIDVTKISGTAVNLSSTQTVSGVKTFSGNNIITGTEDFQTAPKFTFGTEAEGDTFYSSSNGTITRLPKGTNGQLMTMAAGVPSWASGDFSSIDTPSVSTISSTSTSSTSYTDSGLTVTFTPSASSLALVLVSINWYNSGANTNKAAVLLDGSIDGFDPALQVDFASGSKAFDSTIFHVLTGLTNASHTVKVQIKTDAGTLAINRARLVVIPWV